MNIPINNNFNGKLNIYNEKGSHVYTPPDPLLIEGEKIRLDVSELPSGTYMLVLDNGVSYKLIVNK